MYCAANSTAHSDKKMSNKKPHAEIYKTKKDMCGVVILKLV